MALSKIKIALETRLATLTPTMDTAYEAVDFKPKTTPYQYVQLVPNTPDNANLGDKYYREVGQFQVFLSYKSGNGVAEALNRAELIRDLFKRGTSIVTDNGNIKINFLYTPIIGSWTIAQDRVVVPVIIRYSAEIFNHG